jgi:hypothetical protein
MLSEGVSTIICVKNSSWTNEISKINKKRKSEVSKTSEERQRILRPKTVRVNLKTSASVGAFFQYDKNGDHSSMKVKIRKLLHELVVERAKQKIMHSE